MANKIEIRDLCKSFGSKHILKNIDLDVPEGRSLVILGGSGSGKSVLLKTIIGILKADKGSIRVDGQETLGMSHKSRVTLLEKFGMLFQGGALFDSITVWENITFGLRQRQKISDHDAIEIATEKLKQVGLSPDTAKLFPSELSGGMQKRVSLARATCMKPEIIFFDEPTTGLDPILASVINELIVETVKKLGATTVTITHNMSSMTRIADDVALLYKGNVIWRGTGEEVWKTDNPHVTQFIHGHAEGPMA
ncbi:MAG: ATP-binding cassette domain-containing protein [Pseudomonadota bacterium]